LADALLVSRPKGWGFKVHPALDCSRRWTSAPITQAMADQFAHNISPAHPEDWHIAAAANGWPICPPSDGPRLRGGPDADRDGLSVLARRAGRGAVARAASWPR